MSIVNLTLQRCNDVMAVGGISFNSEWQIVINGLSIKDLMQFKSKTTTPADKITERYKTNDNNGNVIVTLEIRFADSAPILQQPHVMIQLQQAGSSVRGRGHRHGNPNWVDLISSPSNGTELKTGNQLPLEEVNEYLQLLATMGYKVVASHSIDRDLVLMMWTLQK